MTIQEIDELINLLNAFKIMREAGMLITMADRDKYLLSGIDFNHPDMLIGNYVIKKIDRASLLPPISPA